jgi:hypothetical protein
LLIVVLPKYLGLLRRSLSYWLLDWRLRRSLSRNLLRDYRV